MSATTTEQSTPERGRAPQSGGGREARGRDKQSGGGREARGRDKQSAGAGGEPVPARLEEGYRAGSGSGPPRQVHYSHVMQVPALLKIAVNRGVGDAARDAKLIEGAVKARAIITGQKPAVARAKKSIAQFKLREGMPIGAHVTLRGDRMWEFLDRLLTLALPRIRDFRGLS